MFTWWHDADISRHHDIRLQQALRQREDEGLQQPKGSNIRLLHDSSSELCHRALHVQHGPHAVPQPAIRGSQKETQQQWCTVTSCKVSVTWMMCMCVTIVDHLFPFRHTAHCTYILNISVAAIIVNNMRCRKSHLLKMPKWRMWMAER